MDGPSFIAECLRSQNISHMYGIVGIPVTPIAFKAQERGISFVAMRNEQAASYAAGAAGYLTGHTAVCLTVAGPGMVHAIGGLLNAQANGWPMILLSACSEISEEGRGAFQESSQIQAALPYVKHAARVTQLARFPFQLEQAVRIAKYGKPGPVYIEIPADVVKSTVQTGSVKFVPCVPDPPIVFPDPASIREAIDLLKTAQKPLVIVGSGAAYFRAEEEINEFLNITRFPFLPSPMGKGLIPDDSEFSAAAARSIALADCDICLCIEQPMNWQFAYGEFSEKVRFIQVESHAEDINHNIKPEVALNGSVKAVVGQLIEGAKAKKLEISLESSWWQKLREKKIANSKAVEVKCQDNSVPLTYYRVLKSVADLVTKDTIVVNEGANTLDIGRNLINNQLPRHRLDSGVLGTMGVGLGYAVAAATVFPAQKVVSVHGDSAFGFSGMEVEVACRYQLPITFIVLNNNGIYSGISSLSSHSPTQVPPTGFVPNARYEKIIEAFGGKGYHIEDIENLDSVLKEAIQTNVPTLVNIAIDPAGPIPRNVQKHEQSK